MAQPNEKPPALPQPPNPDGRDGTHKSQFAAALARAEFGRFYWKAGRPKPTGKPKAADGTR